MAEITSSFMNRPPTKLFSQKPIRRSVLLSYVILMATTLSTIVSRVGVTATPTRPEALQKLCKESPSFYASKGTNSLSATQKRRSNPTRFITSLSNHWPQIGGAPTKGTAFVHSQACQNIASTTTPILTSRSMIDRSRITELAASSASSALFSSSSEDNAVDASPATSVTSQKTLAKQPLDDSLEVCIFEDSEYHVYESEQTIKKSRFIGLARYADDWKDASNFVEHIRTKVHPKARHWCFAYRGSIVGEGEEIIEATDASFATSTTITERASDDGEPSGTAGQPILNALTTETTAPEGLIDAVVVVVRYSGGIKLGAGGLIRAYGGTARMVLQEHAQHQVEVIPKQKFSLSSIQPKHVGVVYDLAAKYGAIVEATNDDYTSFSVICDSEVAQVFKAGMMDATRGSAVIR